MGVRKVPRATLEELVGGAVAEVGYSARDSKVVARHLVAAEAGGVQALGLVRVDWIARIIREGAPAGDPSVVERSSGGSVLVDGRGGLGYLAVERGLRPGIEVAERDGVAVVGVRGTFLTGVLRSYCDDLAGRGLASLIVGSAAPPLVAPGPGGHAVLGTNPLAIGIPGDPFHILFDTSATDLPYSEVAARARRDHDLPPGIGLDSTGLPTIDPREVIDGGALLGWGGHRGFGMAVAVQALGMVVGAPPVASDLADCGLLALIVDPARLTRTMKRAIDTGALLEAVTSASADGVGRLPGQQWHRRQLAASTEGLDVDEDTLAMLDGWRGHRRT